MRARVEQRRVARRGLGRCEVALVRGVDALLRVAHVVREAGHVEAVAHGLERELGVSAAVSGTAIVHVRTVKILTRYDVQGRNAPVARRRGRGVQAAAELRLDPAEHGAELRRVSPGIVETRECRIGRGAYLPVAGMLGVAGRRASALIALHDAALPGRAARRRRSGVARLARLDAAVAAHRRGRSGGSEPPVKPPGAERPSHRVAVPRDVGLESNPLETAAGSPVIQDLSTFPCGDHPTLTERTSAADSDLRARHNYHVLAMKDCRTTDDQRALAHQELTIRTSWYR